MGFAGSTHPTKSTSAQPARQSRLCHRRARRLGTPRHSPVGARPARDSRAGRAYVPGSTAFRRMVLSEAIPITATAWVSQAQPILRRAPRRGLQDSRTYATSEHGVSVHHAIPLGARPARDSRAGPAYVPGSTAFRRMALSEAIPISATAWVSQAQHHPTKSTSAQPARQSHLRHKRARRLGTPHHSPGSAPCARFAGRARLRSRKHGFS
ncbi:hypothetical protein PcP3B5_56130 [Pseudomonas citronellolis]|nr:hypothetical protein PcP3B5_56130 [Pseudomonas citronellolis]